MDGPDGQDGRTERRRVSAPRRQKVPGQGRRVNVGCMLLPAAEQALIEAAAAKGVSITAYVAELVAEDLGVPA